MASREQLEELARWCRRPGEGSELEQAREFLDRLFRALKLGGLDDILAEGTFRARPAADRERGGSLADLIWKQVVLIQMKRRGEDLMNHLQKAADEWFRLSPGRPRHVILCNFAELWIFDFGSRGSLPIDKLLTTDLPSRGSALAFLAQDRDFGGMADAMEELAEEREESPPPRPMSAPSSPSPDTAFVKPDKPVKPAPQKFMERTRPPRVEINYEVTEEGHNIFPVWFATNRAPVDAADLAKGFGTQRSGEVHRGLCKVCIPKWHEFGSVGAGGFAGWMKRWLLGRDDRLTLREIISLGEELYWRKIGEALSIFPADERIALVYLHGYNVSFEEAAIRAAQLGCDLKVQGATAFFSWPSRGSLKGYAADEASIEASEPFIRDFLVDVARKSGAARVHILAHSMGNRGLLRSIERIAGTAQEMAGVRFGQIILAAPDVDADVFRALAHHYPPLAERTTLYVSSKDRALGMSEFLHGFDRAGFTPPVTVVPGLDTVEVGNIDLTLLG
ncbi:MAG TPA: hypothetical protein DCY13_09915, partial [Verrucomicrobiales bacterium]|nr:hypothetical protein [Verrucomicrobiales bacterium]